MYADKGSMSISLNPARYELETNLRTKADSLSEYMKTQWFTMKEHTNSNELVNILDSLQEANWYLPKERKWNLNDTSRDWTPIKDRVYWDKDAIIKDIIAWMDSHTLSWRYRWFWDNTEQMPTIWIDAYNKRWKFHVPRSSWFVPRRELPIAPWT